MSLLGKVLTSSLKFLVATYGASIAKTIIAAATNPNSDSAIRRAALSLSTTARRATLAGRTEGKLSILHEEIDALGEHPLAEAWRQRLATLEAKFHVARTFRGKARTSSLNEISQQADEIIAEFFAYADDILAHRPLTSH